MHLQNCCRRRGFVSCAVISSPSLYAADNEEKPPAPTNQAVKGRWDQQRPVAQLASQEEAKAEARLKPEVENEAVTQQGSELVRQDGKPVREAQQDAHAAAFSLEAVMEAQSALIHERHHKAQPSMTEEEKKAHRRRQESLSVCTAEVPVIAAALCPEVTAVEHCQYSREACNFKAAVSTTSSVQ